MKKISVIIIIVLLVLCGGCKKTHCPAFPTNLNYFPYTKDIQLEFINSQQEIRTFVIKNAGNSDAWSFDWNCKCECSATSSFQMYPYADSLEMSYLSIYGNIHISGEEGDLISQFDIIFGISSSEALAKTIAIDKPVPISDISKHLADTISIEADNNKIVKKIVIVKDKGLVSYTTADGEEWKLVE